MGVDQDVVLEAKAIRYRVTWTQLTLLWLTMVLTYGTVAFVSWLLSPDEPWDEGFNLPLLAAVTALTLAGVSRLMSVTLTADALIHRHIWRRVVPWANVSQITTASLLGGRSVVVYEHSGRRMRLRAPVTGLMYWDRDFDAKFHTIGEWFMAHRGVE